MASSTQTQTAETTSPRLELKAEKSPQPVPPAYSEASEQTPQAFAASATDDRVYGDNIDQAPRVTDPVPVRYYANDHEASNLPVNDAFPDFHERV